MSKTPTGRGRRSKPAGDPLLTAPYVARSLDGMLVVCATIADSHEPILYKNYFPTAISWEVWQEYGLGEVALGYDRSWGCYYYRDPTGGQEIRVAPADGGNTRSIRTEKIPYPPPALGRPVRYRGGRWEKRLSRGWVPA